MEDNINSEVASSSSSTTTDNMLLPIANVGRIMKQILPSNAKISKEAKETMQECVSEFIGFVTSEASEKCRNERRKTVNGEDICSALQTLGFDDYGGALKRYLSRYREIEGDRVVINQNKPSGNNNNNYNNILQEDFLLYTSTNKTPNNDNLFN